ncbi:MAG: hypothetical protein HZB26_09510 [Candidatus Hydrogenedentes bacterium]|nr:hypothetical protein [Candidatus Hydrogenedentota bacterium]
MNPALRTALVSIVAIALCLSASAELRAVAVRALGGSSVQINDGDHAVLLPLSPKGMPVALPGQSHNVKFRHSKDSNATLTMEGGAVPGLTFTESYRSVTPCLIERTVTVTATADRRYYIDLGWKTATEGAFYSFMGKEEKTANYSASCSGPEFAEHSMQTFPFLGYRVGVQLFGVIGDTPGLWENRSFLKFDIENRLLSLTNGDGSAKRIISIPATLDATSVYRAQFDGWQHIEVGETQTWRTWIFSSPAKSLYDVQLAAHLALANAKGFNRSGLEAILRNTPYLLLRRNLLRSESDYIFISGVGYGWKQWVSDGFWMSRGLDDPKFDDASQKATFFERINYEDNAQYYLIWAVLTKRSGAEPDMRTVGRAYRFMREHEHDGLYVPPRLKPETPQFKTYHDLLPYDDDDSPSSDQGFHCGALMAAKELGFDVKDEDIAKSIAGYRRMFNAEGGYMASSLKQQDHIGQDSLYGEVLTYAVFGQKLLPDEVVRKHLETTMRIQSPYGMRVISKANGDLLDGHSGEYVFGGSWFLNDGANYLDGLIHGMDPQWIDDKLLWRLEKELAFMPAFHESISTVTGKPHGHHLYSWNSGFWWLRREICQRLGITTPDPLEQRLDKELGVTRSKDPSGRGEYLALDPGAATLRPKE